MGSSKIDGAAIVTSSRGLVGERGDITLSRGPNGLVGSQDGSQPAPLINVVGAPVAAVQEMNRVEAEWARIVALGIGLNDYIDIPLNCIPKTTAVQATASANQWTKDGGGQLSTGNPNIDYLAGQVLQACRTRPWAFIYYGQILGPTAARTAEFATINTANSHVIAIMTDNAVSASKFITKIIGGTTTSAIGTFDADQQPHLFSLVGDPVSQTVKGSIDGINGNAGVYPFDANIFDEGMFPIMFSTVAADVAAQKCRIGYMQP